MCSNLCVCSSGGGGNESGDDGGLRLLKLFLIILMKYVSSTEVGYILIGVCARSMV